MAELAAAARGLARLALGALFLVAWLSPAVAMAELPTELELTAEQPHVDVTVLLELDGLLHVTWGGTVDCADIDQAGQVDGYLWLFDSSGAQLAADDDGDHGAGACYRAKLHQQLTAGTYVVRLGACCGRYYGTGTASWSAEVTPPTTSTSSSTTTTSTSSSTTTTSTSSSTTTTSTTSTSTSTSTSSTSTTSTTLPPTTTTSTSSSTTTTSTTSTSTSTSTSSTSTTSTTLPPTTTSSSTTSSSTTSTTTAPVVTTSVVGTVPSTTLGSATVPTTTPSSSTSSSTPTPTAPPAGASDAERLEWQATVDLFDGTWDDYVPVGSTITVAQRRSVVAASSASVIIAQAAGGRKRGR